jgi:hypothetical protein
MVTVRVLKMGIIIAKMMKLGTVNTMRPIGETGQSLETS